MGTLLENPEEEPEKHKLDGVYRPNLDKSDKKPPNLSINLHPIQFGQVFRPFANKEWHDDTEISVDGTLPSEEDAKKMGEDLKKQMDAEDRAKKDGQDGEKP